MAATLTKGGNLDIEKNMLGRKITKVMAQPGRRGEAAGSWERGVEPVLLHIPAEQPALTPP